MDLFLLMPGKFTLEEGAQLGLVDCLEHIVQFAGFQDHNKKTIFLQSFDIEFFLCKMQF